MSDQKKRFEHSEITQIIKDKIPLDEFQKGDFSHLPDALEIYQQTITELSKVFAQDITGENDVDIHIKKEQHRMIEVKKNIKDKEKQIKELEKKLIATITALEKASSENTYWKNFIKILRENSKNDPFRFEEIISAHFWDHEEDREKVGGSYSTFREIPIFEEIKTIQLEINKTKWELSKEKKHPIYVNGERYNESLKRGGVKADIEAHIREKIREFFWQKIGPRDYDHRDTKTVFIEKIADQLIFNHRTDPKIKKDLVRAYDDKAGLFVYIFQDIYKWDWLRSNDYKYDTENRIADIRGERLAKIEELFTYLEERLSEHRARQEWLFLNEKDISREDIQYLKEKLQEPNKTHWAPVYTNEDKKIRQLWWNIDSLFDEHRLISEYQMLRNFDFMKIAEGKENVKQTLERLFMFMDEKDRQLLISEYKNDYTMNNFLEYIQDKTKPEFIQAKIRTDAEQEELNPTPIPEPKFKNRRGDRKWKKEPKN